VRVLYFDIDGTLLPDRGGFPKQRLAAGAFEAAARSRSFDRLVCVGSVVDVLGATRPADPLRTVFEVCKGTFTDEDWFRQHVKLLRDTGSRAAQVDLEQDWWFVDDLAEHYFTAAGRGAVFERERGRRIMVPDPEDDGSSTLVWLRQIPDVGSPAENDRQTGSPGEVQT